MDKMAAPAGRVLYSRFHCRPTRLTAPNGCMLQPAQLHRAGTLGFTRLACRSCKPSNCVRRLRDDVGHPGMVGMAKTVHFQTAYQNFSLLGRYTHISVESCRQ